MAFNREAFNEAFGAAIDALLQSEQVTKRELRSLSRTVLEATHETGDIAYVNRLIGVLSPVNRKVCIVYFKHFTGFSFDDKLGLFTKKSKKRYAKAFAEYVQFIAEPGNNVWTWAERNIEVEAKPFSVEKFGTYMKGALQKAHDDGVSNADVMRAIIKAGMDADSIIACMESLAQKDEEKEALLGKVSDALGFEVNKGE